MATIKKMEPMKTLPGSLLFACTHNMVRSPMAEAMLQARFAKRIFLDSCGIHPGTMDGFTVKVMEEVGLDISSHAPKNFDDLQDDYFDMVVCFSEESFAIAREFARGKSTDVEYWPVYDVALTSENQQLRLNAYRYVRDVITRYLNDRFPDVEN